MVHKAYLILVIFSLVHATFHVYKVIEVSFKDCVINVIKFESNLSASLVVHVSVEFDEEIKLGLCRGIDVLLAKKTRHKDSIELLGQEFS